MINVAFASIPKDSGTFTFYRNLRQKLKQKGVNMFCVSVGRREAELWDKAYVDENCVMLAPKTIRLKAQAQAFERWVVDARINIVFGINSRPILSSLRHLPKDVHVLSRCANGFDHGYKITLSGAERLEKIVALTPKLQKDLVNEYGVSSDLIELIPNGIDPEYFALSRSERRGLKPHLALAFVGRLEHNQKGVLHLPKILQKLEALDVPYELQIAGKGRDRKRLEQMFTDFGITAKVTFVGSLNAEDLEAFMANQDILLFTSHFEGCPNTLLEAKMAGLVPLSWLIEGTTDFIIDDKKTGFVFELGNYNLFAETIYKLHRNRKLLQEMSLESSKRALEKFTSKQAASRYALLFDKVISNTSTQVALPWSNFKADPNFGRGLSDYFPKVISNKLKKIKNLFS